MIRRPRRLPVGRPRGRDHQSRRNFRFTCPPIPGHMVTRDFTHDPFHSQRANGAE